MIVRPVDPRDQQWEQAGIRFRVVFYLPATAGEGQRAGITEEYEIEEADLEVVLTWAKREAESKAASYAISVVVDRQGSGLGVVHLVSTQG